MNDLAHRFALIVLVSCGLLSMALLPFTPSVADSSAYAVPERVWDLLEFQHWHFLLAVLALALVAAAFVPALRAAAIGAGILSKLAYIGLALVNGMDEIGDAHTAWLEGAMVLALLAAAIILAREALQEARWNGMLPLGPEA